MLEQLVIEDAFRRIRLYFPNYFLSALVSLLQLSYKFWYNGKKHLKRLSEAFIFPEGQKVIELSAY